MWGYHHPLLFISDVWGCHHPLLYISDVWGCHHPLLFISDVWGCHHPLLFISDVWGCHHPLLFISDVWGCHHPLLFITDVWGCHSSLWGVLWSCKLKHYRKNSFGMVCLKMSTNEKNQELTCKTWVLQLTCSFEAQKSLFQAWNVLKMISY